MTGPAGCWTGCSCADRGSLLTELMTGVIGEFGIDCSRLHNDSTSVSVHGAYQGADGSEVAGTPTAAITFGHSKDHRPDLKQLVYILTVSGDHAVPVIYRLADGNTSDDPTHIPTWDAAGEADRARRVSCTSPTASWLAARRCRHIHGRGGRFITVLPRSRKEDAAFRAWMQDHQPAWAEAHREPGARLGDPDQVWSVCEAPWPSAEGYRIVWVHDSGKQQRDAATRARRIEKAVRAIEDDLAAQAGLPAVPAAHRRGRARRRRGRDRRRGRHQVGPLHRAREDRGVLPAGRAGLPGRAPPTGGSRRRHSR